MRDLQFYQNEMTEITEEAGNDKSTGEWFLWGLILIGVIFTGTMTYSLSHKGMSSSVLWKGWVDFAALMPVGLMEGSAIGLTYGKHHWFRSTDQRELAETASWIVWIVLMFTSVAHFALGNIQDPTVQSLMNVYASYFLPLAIVLIPMLAKRLYDMAPRSQLKVSILEAEAKLRSELVAINSEQNDLIVEAYRGALDTDLVREARKSIFERASIQHAQNIAGFLPPAEVEAVEGEPVDESTEQV